MKRNILAVGVIAYVLRPSEEASAPIEAVPIAESTEPATSTNEEPATEPVETAEPDQAAAPAASLSGNVLYAISQADSEVRFSIDELLRNQPVTAVGITDQIAGEISVAFDNPDNSQVGEITVNA